MHRRQPEAGALALSLGGEERLEQPPPDLLRDADAGISDLEPGERAVAAGAHREHAPVPHRVHGVDGEVGEHLLELAAVALDREGAGHFLDLQADRRRRQADEEVRRGGNQLVEIERLAPAHVLAREDEELAGVACATLDCVLDLAEGDPERRLVRPLCRQQPCRRQHRLQVVVELVRHPAGERRHRFEALRFLQLRRQLDPVGDVAADSLEFDRLPGDIGEGPERPGDDAPAAVGRDVAQPDRRHRVVRAE